MLQAVILEMERIHSGSVRLALLPAGVQHVADPFHLQVGGLLHRVVVPDGNVPEVRCKVIIRF